MYNTFQTDPLCSFLHVVSKYKQEILKMTGAVLWMKLHFILLKLLTWQLVQANVTV